MPFTDEGFTPRSAREIVEDYEEKAKNIFTVVNFSPSSILWQQMKVHAIDEFYYETMLETASEQMSIRNAVGEWLDRHGIEAGLRRRGARHAQGYVDVSTNITGPSIGIPEGTQFSSSLNAYATDEADTIEFKILMSKGRTGESTDYFTNGYIYVNQIVNIFDEKDVTIPSSLYSLDPTYKNNIIWLAGSSGYLLENEQYYVQVQGTVTKQIEVTALTSGVVSNAKIGEVTTSVTYPYLSVANSRGISGGADREADDRYRERLLQAQRRQFTLEKVRDIAAGIDGVRAVKVTQDKGVDQTAVTDWDNPTNLGIIRADTYDTKISQSFVPGDLVLSMGRVTLKGRAVNNPPAVTCGVRLNTSPTGYYLPDATKIMREIDLDPTITGFQDINFDMKYNGLDKTKTYRFDIYLHPSEDGITGFDASTHYWEFYTVSGAQYGSGPRYQLYTRSGVVWTGEEDRDMMFKTLYNGAAYTVVLATEDGFGFVNLAAELEEALDYIDGGGLSPIGIQFVINEATEIDIDVKGIIYIDPLADFITIRDDVIANIETYLESLETGENVIYAEIEHQIMKHPSVVNQKEVYIKRSDTSIWAQDDINILDDEIPDLGTRSFQRGVA